MACRRVENRKALESEITELTKRRTQQDWIGALKEVGVPCGQVNDIAQAFSDPQLHHRNMFLHLDHPASGTVTHARRGNINHLNWWAS
jgi:crotonobetainyl-CoA:carnitine CoA-transferase CaiB-like acyl-CoA transferase